MIDKVWKKEFYTFGIMNFERILFEYEGVDITFVCLNQVGERFLCHCTDAISVSSWLVTRVTNDELIKLLDSPSPLNNLFKTKEQVILLEENEGKTKYTVYNGDRIPDDELPADDYAIHGSFEDYISILGFSKVVFFPKTNIQGRIINWPQRSKKTKNNSIRKKYKRVNVSARKKINKKGVKKCLLD